MSLWFTFFGIQSVLLYLMDVSDSGILEVFQICGLSLWDDHRLIPCQLYTLRCQRCILIGLMLLLIWILNSNFNWSSTPRNTPLFRIIPQMRFILYRHWQRRFRSQVALSHFLCIPLPLQSIQRDRIDLFLHLILILLQIAVQQLITLSLLVEMRLQCIVAFCRIYENLILLLYWPATWVVFLKDWDVWDCCAFWNWLMHGWIEIKLVLNLQYLLISILHFLEHFLFHILFFNFHVLYFRLIN